MILILQKTAFREPQVKYYPKKELISEQNQRYLPEIENYSKEIDSQIEINSHYKGYLKKQNADIMAFKKDENLKIPENINYDIFSELSNEVKSKFDKFA